MLCSQERCIIKTIFVDGSRTGVQYLLLVNCCHRILVKSLHLQSKQVHHYLTLELATSIIETRLVQQKQTVVLATLLRQTEMG